MADFQSLLQEQKQQQDKEQVAISEAAQTYSLQIQKELGLGQSFIKKEGISNAAVSVVQNFQQDLDLIADADFTGFKDIVQKYKALLGELEGSRRFDKKEKKYISDIVAPVLAEVYPLANAFTAARFGLRDFVKQFKPIKLAARVFGGVPILGTAIQKKIERQEAGEQELRRAERTRAKDIARESRREIEEQIDGTAPVQSSAQLEEQREELDDKLPGVPDYGVKDVAMGRPLPADFKMGAQSEEQREEAVARQQEQFEEEKGLLEMIAESTYETNETLKKLAKDGDLGKDDDGGLLSSAAGVGGGAAGLFGLNKLRQKFFGKKGAETAAKTTGKKVVSKTVGKTLLKSAVKKIPVIGLLAGIGFGLGRLTKGDFTGAALEVASGAASTIPGVGTGASVAIDAGLAARDIKQADKVGDAKVEQVVSEQIQEVPSTNMKDFVNIDSKRTVVRTTLEADGLENMLSKMLTTEPKTQNNINTGGNVIQNANTNTVLPDMNNRNIDDTINALKNVY